MFDVFYFDSGQKPNLFAHERAVESIQHAQQLSRTRYFWIVNYLVDYSGWDWLYEPKPWESHQRHAWGSQHQSDSGTYLVPCSDFTETNYHTNQVLKRLVDSDNPMWEVPGNIDQEKFDFSWHPNVEDKPYIYQFATQHQKSGGPRYIVPGATETKYVNTQSAVAVVDITHWQIPLGIDTTEFDFSWHPDNTDQPYIYQFGTQWGRSGGPKYIVPGATETKYVNTQSAVAVADMTCWQIPPGIDTTDFDFSWHPEVEDKPYIYQFATQHQKTGGPVYTVPGATEVKYLSELRIQTVGKATAIIEVDHLDGNVGQIPNVTRCVRYFDNYRDTLIRLSKSLVGKHEWVWVCSSICDYTGFDFSWHPEQWQGTMLHVFPSNDQKFGDTFFVHVPTFAERAEKKALLEWYDVNFVDKIVPRRPMPVIEHTADSHVDVVKNQNWSGPLALFSTNGVPITLPTVPLWRSETKTITSLSAGASAVIVPRVAVPHIKTQLYDYPYIDKTQQRRHGDQALDIVFISNGELSADKNYHRLDDSKYNRNNRLKRIDRVNGRAAAYHAAARASTTPWFFAVFAKLDIRMDFPWDWQPDRMQEPKHYIFHAYNPVNGLEYGHQAMIAYNRDLVLNNPGVGLDFTLDSAHEVVPINSGTAWYTDTPWQAWRTAFREAVKLRASLPDVESEYRLNAWLNNGDGWNGEWSRDGAADGVEYFEQVQGDFAELRKSYEWDWLASYAFMKRNLLPDQQ